jgi:hypothetical protein
VDYPNDPYSHPVLDGKGGFTQAMYGGYKKDAPDAMRLGDIAKRPVKAVKRHDASRPVTAGLAGVAMSNETEYPFVLDIAGYNYTETVTIPTTKNIRNASSAAVKTGTTWTHGKPSGTGRIFSHSFYGRALIILGNRAYGLRVGSIRVCWILQALSNRAATFAKRYGATNRLFI